MAVSAWRLTPAGPSCCYTGAMSHSRVLVESSAGSTRFWAVSQSWEKRLSFVRPRRTTPLPLDGFFVQYDRYLGIFRNVEKIVSLKLTRKASTWITPHIRDSISPNSQYEMFSGKSSRENLNPLYVQYIFPRKLYRYEVIWKNTVQPDRPTTWFYVVLKIGLVNAGLLMQEYGHLCLIVIIVL